MANELEMAVRRAEAAVADAEAGGRYDHCRDDGLFVEALQTADLRLILSANREMREREEVLTKSLSNYDESVSVCPIRANDPRATAAERCPVCMATTSQGCGREASASYRFINEARSALTAQRGGGE